MKENKTIRVNITIFLSLVLVVAAISGCAKPAAVIKKEMPEDLIKKRFRQYAHAMSINDFDATYRMESEATRRKMSLNQYIKVKHSSNAENEIYRVSRVQYDKVEKRYIVKIKVTIVNIPKILKLSLADMRGEVWVYQGGDWYRKGPLKRKYINVKKPISKGKGPSGKIREAIDKGKEAADK